MSILDRLTEQFIHFPGIGPRQAKRFVYYLLTRDHRTLDSIARLIGELKNEVHHCELCFRYFTGRERKLCDICANPNRAHEVLMVVEKDADLETIERSGGFEGVYFILGGTVPILDKEPEKRVRASALLKRITAEDGNLREIILALSATTEGDITERYLKELLEPHRTLHSITISHLGRGLSTGTELEYSDADTIRNALQNRS